MNSTIILIIAACLIILYAAIKATYRSSGKSNGLSQKDYLKPSDDNTSNSISSTEEIGTVNTFLHEQEINKNIYIVKQVFYKPGNTKEEAYSSEKVFDKGSGALSNSNEIRLKEAQKYFDITCQNILLKISMGKTDATKIDSFTVTLSCVHNVGGIIETTILKSIDQDSYSY
ncbi:MAG: hypothetical protein WCO54_11995 [Bacteroidota bacterium]